jgi:hypothetical protein
VGGKRTVGRRALQRLALEEPRVAFEERRLPRLHVIHVHLRARGLEVEPHTGVVQEVVGEALLDEVALVAETHGGLGAPSLTVALHAVPEDPVLTDLGRGLARHLGLLPQARAQASGKDDAFMRPPV